ncbi:MAG TPA: hypothetical protein QGG47_07675 [Acidobacteriota bacterium]|nr:hypothetical protein [Acidobacteriota bacterium]
MSAASGLRKSLFATVAMAVTSTVADAFWAAAIPEHRALYGLVHGGLLLAVMGLVIAWATGGRRSALAALGGLLIGVVSAAFFYLLFPVIGVTAMVVAWMTLWVAFAFVGSAAGGSETSSRTVTRGVLAALFSGIGFWLISDIWLGAHDPGAMYWRNFVYWCVAFLPGFAALLLWRDSSETAGY